LFGTIAVVKPLPGQEDAVSDMFEQWWDERRPKVKGAIASSFYRNPKDPNELMMAVVFDTRENYEANASDPEQVRWNQRLLTLLEGEPRWIEREVGTNGQTQE
jgi:quinol monooxygenase YgiN